MTIGRTWKVAGIAVLAAVVPAPGASASPNNGPTNAVAVKVGVPFTGSWPGSKEAFGGGLNHWWRLPGPLRAGDELQLAVDNRAGPEISLCLVPPVDEFGADDALVRCDAASLSAGRQDRWMMTYGEQTGLPFLVVFEDCDCEVPLFGNYTVTIERIITLVNAGLTVPRVLPSSFSLNASLTYGDNTAVADGVPAHLQWRFLAPRGDDPEPFVNVVTASSSGGSVTFSGTMPSHAQGRTVQLRACVTQPGSDTVRCGPSGRSTVTISPCTRAQNSELSYSRAVNRLKRKLRRAKARGATLAKRRVKHRLTAKRRKLAQAKRSVKAHC